MRIAFASFSLFISLTASADRKIVAQPPAHEIQLSSNPYSNFSDEQADRAGKSPVLASVFSLVLPGVGSFYAGSPGHGWRHAAIGAVTGFGMLAGATYACKNNIACDGGNEVGYELFGISALLYLANGIWGAVTAAADVKATDRQLASAAALRLAPTLFRFPSGVRISVERRYDRVIVGARIGF